MNIDFSSVGTHRFGAYLIGMVSLTVLGGISLALKVDAALVVAVMTPLVTVAGAMLGFGNWHDKGVRTEMIRAEKEKSIAVTTADLQRQVSNDIPTR